MIEKRRRKKKNKKKLKIFKNKKKLFLTALIGFFLFFFFIEGNSPEKLQLNKSILTDVSINIPVNIKNTAKIIFNGFRDNAEKIMSKKKEQYKVLYISDGDTIAVKRIENNEQTGKLIKIRLLGIDAPELSQDYGYESKAALMRMIKDKNIQVTGKEKDRYGRLLRTVYCDGKNINEEMVKEGHAWWYEQYDKENFLMKRYEENAKKNKLGLFSRKGYIPPWEFRKHKSKIKK